ncbi:hypothetical protein [Sphingomonas sp. SAFR-052]|uniref:hypothetical protein n=1 Tax=Sphingomonas sp. SAFR-052 TaxID=3436867 RepID=UPI003F81CA58
MRRAAIALVVAVAAASQSACVGLPAPSADTIERIQSRFDRARPYAELALPHLSPARADRVRLALALVERALTAARTATTLIEQQRALKAAETALSIVPAPVAR